MTSCVGAASLTRVFVDFAFFFFGLLSDFFESLAELACVLAESEADSLAVAWPANASKLASTASTAIFLRFISIMDSRLRYVVNEL